MHTSKIIHTVSCHAEGEVGDVIVGEWPHLLGIPSGSSPGGLQRIKPLEISCSTNPGEGFFVM